MFSLWKDVTYHLKAKQLDKATQAKTFLEQRQRAEAKERLENSIKWNPKVSKTHEVFPNLIFICLILAFCRVW